jgi:hypothetical protein
VANLLRTARGRTWFWTLAGFLSAVAVALRLLSGRPRGLGWAGSPVWWELAVTAASATLAILAWRQVREEPRRALERNGRRLAERVGRRP